MIAAAGCTAPDSPTSPLVIGVLSAHTGPGADTADEARRGAQLAIDIVNEDHGALSVPLGAGTGLPALGGSRLALAGADSQGKPDQAVRMAADLVTAQGAVGVVVAESADIVSGTASEMQRLRAPLLDASNTADYLTELGLDWYFRAGPGDRVLTESAFGVLRRQSVRRLAVLTEPGGDSAAGAAHIKALAGASGGQIVLQHELTLADSAGGDVAFRLKESGAQAVLAWAHTPEAATSMGRLVPTNIPMVGLGKGFRGLPAPPSGPALMLRPVPWSAELATRSPAAQAVMALYEKRFGHRMSGLAAASFTAVITLAVAIDASASRDPATIRAALRQTSLSSTQMIMPWDGVRFASDGHNSLAGAAVEAWDGSGFHVVYPVELASRPIKWPGARP